MRYVLAAKAAEIKPGQIKMVQGVDRVPVCVINLAGEFYAVSGVCGHKGSLLWEGEVRGEYLKCPAHNAHFRIKDGKNGWPAPRPLRSYPVVVKKDSVYVGSTPASLGPRA